mmetsp:Transcript_37167/g.119458  ORF Transcript_37167/g.119458 Transcript_37167/m.119458 type:complete len:213 (-) Transcript_37167:750-1388(-)
MSSRGAARGSEGVDPDFGLVLLYGAEELLEVALAKATAARPLLHLGFGHRIAVATHALYNLEEERGSVSDWLGEDLEQHALFVSVGQDAKLGALGQLGLAQRIRPQPLRQRGVVEVAGPVHEFKAAARAAHRTDSGDDVGSLERHVLNSGATMLVEVRLDLRLALASGGRLVDGEQHGFVVRGEHHRVEPRVNRADVLRGELCKLVESGDGL